VFCRRISLQTGQFPVTDRYPFSLKLFQQLPTLDLATPVTFFVGENGTGKSTLMRALARKCGVFIWGGFQETTRDDDAFTRALDVEWTDGPVPGSFFSSELFFNFSRIADEDPAMHDFFGARTFGSQSHGEGLISYFRTRYRIKGLYFLDEPETALSPRSQLALLRVLAEMSRDGHAQFVIASHSPILLACPGARLYSFDESPVRPVEYEQTEYYRFYRDFMNDRQRYLEGSP
jgi:predicted ATPase